MRVLVVEDEKRLSEALGEIIRSAKHTVDIVNDGEDGFDYAMSNIYDVIVLDVMLPKMNGFEIVKAMRKEKNSTPVILLTAKSELSDKINGLDSGADDYLTKPFEPSELLARIRALSRRQGFVQLNEIQLGDLILDLSNYTLICGGSSVRLGLKEFEIMRMLISNSKQVVPKEDILLKVWGTESEAEDNNVEVYISFLRKKLVFLNSKVQISTYRKVGYHLEEADR